MTERLPPSYARRLRDLERRLERLERGRGGDTYDVAGDLIVGDDAVAGQGLGRPYLPLVFAPIANTMTVNTTNAAMTALLTATFYKQHPRVITQVVAVPSVADTAGEVDLWDDIANVVLAGPVAVAAGVVTTVTLGPVAVAGAHMDLLRIRVRARRTAGTGSMGLRFPAVTAYGLES